MPPSGDCRNYLVGKEEYCSKKCLHYKTNYAKTIRVYISYCLIFKTTIRKINMYMIIKLNNIIVLLVVNNNRTLLPSSGAGRHYLRPWPSWQFSVSPLDVTSDWRATRVLPGGELVNLLHSGFSRSPLELPIYSSN